ncbi:MULTISPECIES: endonuclease/exonuclease/phosphatase family protein [Legionella]|uniref:EEP domain-containing protein n=1 Tax=Legionella septentrionalis TaxID=2498109 RepID=A0A3S0VBT1_9GAMM|nr:MULTISPECIES: endonuclease/exonuclease/phosphatase family protein [Legionella]MCP0914046.1 endonuclease/exonuclease/phosphatase family protein [Legionella sp. 27cVA30]RUQ90792.1 EEP domain-containing protein [Legionella septentrionalis]RUQ95024.1 EEP domain-containing protein [Legionella septentrionalis]RUR09200.1 EEP domain-containing protein [Legionella septentrionalis]RUR13939.1 EEP domain-containing protein [Legionella septentrionalis]
MQASAQTVSLITYNIHKGFGLGKVRFLLPEMKDAITSLNPDFVFLQEVQGEHRRRQRRIDAWPEAPQFEYIAEKIWPHYVYAKNAVYQAGHHGNAILSKYPFERFENINLSNINRASRGILHSQLVLDGGVKIHLLCVHLGLFKAERTEQCKTLMMRINEAVPEHEPLLMAGDFNDWRMDLSRPLEAELGIQEAFYSVKGRHARSFPAIRPSLCIDRVYFRGMEVSDVQCLQGKPWRMLSDHVPLFAQFTLLSS